MDNSSQQEEGLLRILPMSLAGEFKVRCTNKDKCCNEDEDVEEEETVVDVAKQVAIRHN